MKRREAKAKVSGLIVGCQVPQSLVQALDAEAEREGLSRSAVIRRILLHHVQLVARATRPEVPR